LSYPFKLAPLLALEAHFCHLNLDFKQNGTCRHHIPEQVWHITHRCYKKEFLLKFARDRRRWHSWLFEQSPSLLKSK
jgi:hypothetical protein